MTDKQIIDEVDVSWCEWIREIELDSEYICTCNSLNKTSSYCKDNPNCYYKQLKRKAQSEAKLVKQIQTICDFINNRPEIFKGVYGSVDKIITEYAECKEQELKNICKAFDIEYAIDEETGNLIGRCNKLYKKEQECEELKVKNQKLKEEIEDLITEIARIDI